MKQRDRRECERLQRELQQRIAEGERLTPTAATRQTLAILRKRLEDLEALLHADTAPRKIVH